MIPKRKKKLQTSQQSLFKLFICRNDSINTEKYFSSRDKIKMQKGASLSHYSPPPPV